ncbi:MAG: YjiH family protein [Oscillospiraceae bacterium]|nr:YjiH family protein [Oscillospiraceae bacterium]
MENNNNFRPQGKDIVKFVVVSLIGAFLFLALIPDGRGGFNIPLGYAIDWLRDDVLAAVSLGAYAPYGNSGYLGLHYLLALIFITVSFLGTLVAYIFKPGFIMNNPKIRSIFRSSPIYFISKAVGFAIVWMIFLGIGPDMVISSWTGDVMINLTASLVVIFIFLGPAIPLLTAFGLMEFLGVLIKKVVRLLFTLPGRASVDLMASWFGSSAAAILITTDQHDRGYYTGREAAVVATNFCFVSLPFTFFIAYFIDLTPQFPLFYLVMCITCIILALIMPRIWPLRNLSDTYLPEVGKQIDEDVPRNTSMFTQAVTLAARRAHQTTAKDVVRSGGMNYLNIFMDLIPIILAWGTVALIVVEHTPVFDIIAWPMGHFLNLLGVEGAFDYAPATLVGFVDMFIPAVLLGSAPLETRFALGVLSIVQIIYLAETGVLILKSKMPLNIWKLFVIFMMRTLIALPIIVLLTRLLF